MLNALQIMSKIEGTVFSSVVELFPSHDPWHYAYAWCNPPHFMISGATIRQWSHCNQMCVNTRKESVQFTISTTSKYVSMSRKVWYPITTITATTKSKEGAGRGGGIKLSIVLFLLSNLYSSLLFDILRKFTCFFGCHIKN